MFVPSFPPRSEQDHSNSERKEALIFPHALTQIFPSERFLWKKYSRRK